MITTIPIGSQVHNPVYRGPGQWTIWTYGLYKTDQGILAIPGPFIRDEDRSGSGHRDEAKPRPGSKITILSEDLINGPGIAKIP